MKMKGERGKNRGIFAAVCMLFGALALSACGGATLGEFDTKPTIEQTVLYDENGVKITANGLTYDNFSAQLSVSVENNSDKNLSFVCGSAGYSVNSVNGYMVEDGYMNCELMPGENKTENLTYNFSTLNVFGINKIADMEIGFSIKDDDYNYTYTGPLAIKTSAADSYNYDKNSYRAVLKNGALQKRFDTVRNYFSEEQLFNQYNVCISSSAVFTNVDGEPSLLLEVENNSSDTVYVSLRDMFINGHEVYDSLWSSDSINAGKKNVTYVFLSNLADRYEGEFADISEISQIEFTFGVGKNWYEPEASQKISISLPGIKLPEKE